MWKGCCLVGRLPAFILHVCPEWDPLDSVSGSCEQRERKMLHRKSHENGSIRVQDLSRLTRMLLDKRGFVLYGKCDWMSMIQVTFLST